MGLGNLLTRNIDYTVTNDQTGATAAYTIITDGGPGMYPGWSRGNYRGAMSIPAAWRLSLLIANQLGRIPWHTFREVAGGAPVKLAQPPFLAAPAGSRDSALSVFRSWALDRVWHGNAIGIITSVSPLGYPTSCLPVSAEFVQVKLVMQNDPVVGFAAGEIAYLINGRWYHQREVIHFKGPCAPGELRGMGILEEHFDLLDRSRKLDAAASAVDSSAVPTGLLKSLNPDMSKVEAQELKDAWQLSQRTRTVAVLNPLTEFTPIAWNPTEAQLLESRKYGLTDWANVFGVPLSYVGAENSSRVYSNIEDQGYELLKFGSVGDLIAEFEAVLSANMPRGQYVQGNVNHLLRNDTKSRYEAHAIAVASGFLTPDEVRELEERPPLTAEQGSTLAELNAPAPAANNTPGAGAARPRLAAVRGGERGRAGFDPSQPRHPKGSGEQAGEWLGGPGDDGAGGGLGGSSDSGGGGPGPAARRYGADELADDYGTRVDPADLPSGERRALSNYTGGEFVGMNDYLRNGPSWTNDWAEKPVAELSNLMERYRTPGTVQVVRGITEPPGFPAQGAATGTVIESAGFQSTTIGDDVYREHGYHRTVLSVTVPPGMPAIVVNGTGVKANSAERELILPHRTRYAVTGDEMKGGRRWLTVTALPPE